MVSRRGLLGFVTTGVTASVITWFAVGEDPPVSVDVNVNDETAETVSDATEVNTSLAGADADDDDTDAPAIDLDAAAEQLRVRINDRRTNERGLNELRHSECAQEQALAHAQDMADNEYFDHTSPDGTTQRERYAPCGGGGENAFKLPVNDGFVASDGQVTTIRTTEALVNELMSGWLDSRGHREKGIYGDWVGTGSGLARRGNEVYAVTGFVI